MVEIWRDIKDYEGFYQVSNLGNVRRLHYRNLKKHKNQKGYLKVALCKNGNVKEKFVHRLVAETFIENPFKLEQVNHKDAHKENNTMENLEWCTCKENIKHSYENGLVDAEKRANSRKDNHNVIYKGVTMSLSKFSRESGIGRHKAYNLLNKGYSIDEIIAKENK